MHNNAKAQNLSVPFSWRIDYISRFQCEMYWDSHGMHRSYSIRDFRLYELETAQWHLAAGARWAHLGTDMDQKWSKLVIFLSFLCFSGGDRFDPCPLDIMAFESPSFFTVAPAHKKPRALIWASSSSSLKTSAHFCEFSKPKPISGNLV